RRRGRSEALLPRDGRSVGTNLSNLPHSSAPKPSSENEVSPKRLKKLFPFRVVAVLSRATQVLIAFFAVTSAWGATGDITQDAHGVTLETASGLTRVEIWGDKIARVLHTPTTTLPTINSFAVTGSAANVSWQFQNSGGYLQLSTSSITARIEIATGRVNFLDANSANVLSESASGTVLTGTTVGSPAVATYAVKQKFDLASGE